MIKAGKAISLFWAQQVDGLHFCMGMLKNGELRLKVEASGRFYDFYYAEGDADWQLLAKGVDAINLSTRRANGFIGAVIGLYATSGRLQPATVLD